MRVIAEFWASQHWRRSPCWLLNLASSRCTRGHGRRSWPWRQWDGFSRLWASPRCYSTCRRGWQPRTSPVPSSRCRARFGCRTSWNSWRHCGRCQSDVLCKSHVRDMKFMRLSIGFWNPYVPYLTAKEFRNIKSSVRYVSAASRLLRRTLGSLPPYRPPAATHDNCLSSC